MANIKFEIFRSRKRFNILNWLRRNKDVSYESFVSYLEAKSVMTPGREYFDKALELFESTKKREEQFQESKKVEDKADHKETVPIEVEVVLPFIEEAKQEEVVSVSTKTKTRRRRRKKSENES